MSFMNLYPFYYSNCSPWFSFVDRVLFFCIWIELLPLLVLLVLLLVHWHYRTTLYYLYFCLCHDILSYLLISISQAMWSLVNCFSANSFPTFTLSRRARCSTFFPFQKKIKKQAKYLWAIFRILWRHHHKTVLEVSPTDRKEKQRDCSEAALFRGVFLFHWPSERVPSKNISAGVQADVCDWLLECQAGFTCTAQPGSSNYSCSSDCHFDYCHHHGICTHHPGQPPVCQ